MDFVYIVGLFGNIHVPNMENMDISEKTNNIIFKCYAISGVLNKKHVKKCLNTNNF